MTLAGRAVSPPRASAVTGGGGGGHGGGAAAAALSPKPPLRKDFLPKAAPPLPAHLAAAGAGDPARAPPPTPLLSLGLLADIQTADIPDGASFHGAARFYRAALDGARAAVAAFAGDGDPKNTNTNSSSSPGPVHAVLHLGDLLDAQAAPHAEELVARVLDLLSAAGVPTYHAVGNHCLAALKREGVNRWLGPPAGVAGVRVPPHAPAPAPPSTSTPPSPPPSFPLAHSHYEADLAPDSSLRLIVLDGFAVSRFGWPAGHPLREEAEATLLVRNPNENKFSADGLVGPDRRYVAFGGGLGAGQLDWLRGRLEDAAAAGARVILACHLPLHPDTAPGVCLLWEYEAVLAAIRAVPPGTVIAALGGHSHRDGAATCEESGTHFRVLASVLETPPGQVCHARLDLFEEAVVIRGSGLAADTWAPVVGRRTA